jgi:subtilisin family serine protease
MRLALLILVALALAAPAAAGPGKIAVGVAPGATPAEVAGAAEARTGGVASLNLAALDAVTVRVVDVDRALVQLRRLPGASYLERLDRPRKLAFVPDDPLMGEQWYLPLIRGFDAWLELPALEPVIVAVIDSGLDGTHPEFFDRVEEARSFVSAPALNDSIGHGTMVAGEIAAAANNAAGIAGLGLNVRLLIAKVVAGDGSIPLEAEAKAIRWAVDRGARVINLSLGGRRDPNDPGQDTFSELEAAAVRYAVANGVVVVAATGNCESACPYRYASYPAALPHVLGVSAIRADSTVPRFSNRDRRFNDLAAPGVGVVSTFPLGLSEPDCAPAGYSLCASEEYSGGKGTSFAAPLVSAAAALLLAVRPDLSPGQISAVLRSSAVDISRVGRDAKTGFGRLDVAAAVAALGGPLPPRDRFEPNDDAGASAFSTYFARGAPNRVLAATLDYYDDGRDVYAVRLKRGQRLTVTYRGAAGLNADLLIFSPGTRNVARARPLRQVAGLGTRARTRYRARRGGWHFIEVAARAGTSGDYRIAIARG